MRARMKSHKNIGKATTRDGEDVLMDSTLHLMDDPNVYFGTLLDARPRIVLRVVPDYPKMRR